MSTTEDDLFRILKRVSFSELQDLINDRYKSTFNGLILDKPWKDSDRRFLKRHGWTELECKIAYFNIRGGTSCKQEIERLKRIHDRG